MNVQGHERGLVKSGNSALTACGDRTDHEHQESNVSVSVGIQSYLREHVKWSELACMLQTEWPIDEGHWKNHYMGAG